MRIGIADTMFARVDMAAWAVEVLKGEKSVEIERYTVPGMKDLAVAAKKLVEEHGCDVVLALGWVGKEDVDEQCAHEANIGLIQAELMVNKHILKVFVHEREASDEKELLMIAEDRIKKHVKNALALLKGKDELAPFAGKGRRQGSEDIGELK